MRHLITAGCIACVLLFSLPAHAYIGPGPGLTMISSFFTLVGSIILALVMMLVYPIRLLIRRARQKKPDDTSQES